MELKIPPTISSPQDLTSLQIEIKRYAKWLAHETVKQRVGAKAAAEERPTVSPTTVTFIRDWSTTHQLTQANIDALLAAIDEYKAKAPNITVTLAAPASNSIKEEIVSWCRANISPTVLVTFKFNATLLGGMVIRCGSRIFDWSFRRQILDARTNFPEILRRV